MPNSGFCWVLLREKIVSCWRLAVILIFGKMALSFWQCC